jgi:thymidylate synthase
MITNFVYDIQQEFVRKLLDKEFVADKGGPKTIEIINASFLADEASIFGEVNQDYVKRELEWYRSLSLNVNDIPGGPPAIWKQVSDKDGFINSNYGWCIYSKDNGHQFSKVVDELVASPLSRRAAMIYIRPSMHEDYKRNGMSDFMCTYSTQYFIRDGKLHASVFMRSNDAVYGYKNDYAWQDYIHQDVLQAVNGKSGTVYGLGDLYWNAGSLHVYERHFNLVEEWAQADGDFIIR